MASPPYSAGALSPPGPSPLALPRQRPSLALPGGSASSRKPSALRQTSFPPADTLEAQHAAAEDAALRYSPSQGSLEDEFSDHEIMSAISGGGPGGEQDGSRKRKRGEKRNRGRPPKQSASFRAGSTSLVNGEEGGTPTTSRRGGTVVTGDDDDEPDDDEDEDAGRQSLYNDVQLSSSTTEQETEDNRHLFRNYVTSVDNLPLSSRPGLTTRDMGERYDTWNRAKLRTGDVRKLVNQTLSQSVPANVVTVVSSYTKMFAALLIAEAREVQAEWLAVEAKRADGEENGIYKKLKRSHDTDEQVESQQASNGKQGENDIRPKSSGSDKAKTNGTSNHEADSSLQATQPDTQTQIQLTTDDSHPYPGGAAGLSTSLLECDRGPLLPDHLREALRRYKKGRKGGTVGFTGLSLEGREVAAARMGGRRLFR